MKKGFTLIELLIVMVVVAVLVTLAASKYKIAMEKGRGLEGIHNAQAISDALNAFYIQDGNTYHSNRLQSAIDAAGVTKDRHFTCTIRGGQIDFQDVICERITGRYTIWVFNKEGETTSVGCSGDERYCKALGATKLTDTNLWSF
ncbi:MAG: prepilin-type N-terminal cleavage/methylation domain-containing protein [Elusimicrobiaceae bacterium]|nr:prepilin-type N-terminal cleavage/methylation domain-containing protein [Elusimicrobiaceae bacterium]